MKKSIISFIHTHMKKVFPAILCTTAILALATSLVYHSGVNVLALFTNGSPNSLTKIGDIVQFGGTDWLVLDIQGKKALALSNEILSEKPYHSDNVAITWEECHLRQYLNTEFYDSAFSASEKERIVETTLANLDNPWYNTAGGSDTVDKVFLLSIEEVLQYFGDSGGLENRQDNVTFIKDGLNEKRVAKTPEGGSAWWWLRSAGIFFYLCEHVNSCAAEVNHHGDLSVQGNFVTNGDGGVRPALWISLY